MSQRQTGSSHQPQICIATNHHGFILAAPSLAASLFANHSIWRAVAATRAVREPFDSGEGCTYLLSHRYPGPCVAEKLKPSVEKFNRGSFMIEPNQFIYAAGEIVRRLRALLFEKPIAHQSRQTEADKSEGGGFGDGRCGHRVTSPSLDCRHKRTGEGE